MKLIDNVFSLLPSKDEPEAVNEILKLIDVKHKHTLTRRTKYSPAEQLAINSVFSKYRISPKKIWDTKKED